MKTNTSNSINFSIVPFKAGYYWSKISHKMVYMDDINTIVWEKEDLPVKTIIMTFPEMIEYVIKHPGDKKSHRNAVLRVVDTRFAIKAKVSMNKWNGTIYADLDMANSPYISKLTKEQHNELYNTLDFALQNLCPNNYTYIEHSSSGIGIHCIFYFNCEKTEENYKKYAKYIYNIFRYEIDNYIKDFSHIFDRTICKNAVFDPIYERPYQKLYITGIDYRFYNVTGYCDNIEVEEDEEKIDNNVEIERGQFNVKYITTKKKYNTDYYDRLYILTALKKYVGDIDKCRELWYRFCENITLYKNYTTRQFKNMLDQKWNNINTKDGHIGILKKYGFDIDESNIHFHLKEDEYMYDVIEDVIKFASNGINLLVAGTGVGKTEVWKKLNDLYSQPMEMGFHKPILIVEPMCSIIESKYDESKFNIVTGSKKIGNLCGYEMVVTNYNHLVGYTIDGIEVKKDVESFFDQFELVVVDESHIMVKDEFRSEVLVPFMMALNKIKNTKVIIQTATPLFEKSLLNINKTITIHKKEKVNTKIIYRQIEENKFNISDIICLTNYYISNNKKVYIYWKNGALQNMNMLKSIFPENMIIYHKRDNGSEDMENINLFHKIGKTNVLTSSVYFGVGNDLNDEIEDAAVIVIGNNIWQEDIQAKGRWRNAKNIEMCIILLPQDKKIIEASKQRPFNYSERLNYIRSRYKNIYEDSYIRDKSVIINSQSYIIKSEEYIDYLAKMQVANEYSAQFCIKNDEFKKLGYDVREEIKPLVSNGDYIEELKKYRKNLKDIRNNNLVNMLNGIYDWEKINKDSKLEKCAKIIRQLQTKDILKYCDVDKFVNSKILRYGTFLRFYNNEMVEKSDYAELFSILWVREHMKEIDEDTRKKLGNIEITMEDYLIVCGYFIWLLFRNKNDNDQYIKSKYYDKFVRITKDMCEIEDSLINRIFVNNAYGKEYNDFYKEFFNTTDNLENKTIIKEKTDEGQDNKGQLILDGLIEEIIKLDSDEIYISKVLKYIVDYYSTHGSRAAGGRKGGRKGGKKTKSVTITSNFKHPEKYNLTVGQEFESVNSLSEYTKKSRQTIAQWLKKDWIN